MSEILFALLPHLELTYAFLAGTRLKALMQKPPFTVPDEAQQAYAKVARQTAALEAFRAAPDQPSAQTLNYALDRVLGLIAAACKGIVETYDSTISVPLSLSPGQQARLEAARLVLSTLFADGVTAITLLTHPKQWEAQQRLFNKLDQESPLGKAVERLGMTEDLALLRTLHQRFGDKLGLTEPETALPADKLLAAWHEAYDAFYTVAAYHGQKVAGLRELAWQPYSEALEQQAEERGRGRERREKAAGEAEKNAAEQAKAEEAGKVPPTITISTAGATLTAQDGRKPAPVSAKKG